MFLPPFFCRSASDWDPPQGARSKPLSFWYCVQNHKWLLGPPGSAFLYARREVQHLLDPLVMSWGWEPERTNLLNLDGAASSFVLENEWQGTREPPPSGPNGYYLPGESRGPGRTVTRPFARRPCRRYNGP